MTQRARRAVVRALLAGMSGALLGGLVAAPTPAQAVVEPLPGTATPRFLSGWLPYWRGNAEIDRIVPQAGSEGYVGDVNLFWAYSRYRNLVTNPSVESSASGTTGWTRLGSGTTLARVTSDSYDGSASLQVSRGAGAGAGALTLVTGLTPGTAYAYYVYARVPAGQPSQRVVTSITWRNNSTTISTSTGTATTISSASGWVRLSVTGTAPANTNRAYLNVTTQLAGSAGEVFLVDEASLATSGPVCVHNPSLPDDQASTKLIECGSPSLTVGQQGHLARLKAAGVTTFLTFTDDSSTPGLSGVLRSGCAWPVPVGATPTECQRLVIAQRDFVVAKGFDGIDLDYEDFAFGDGSSRWAKTKPAWIAYITALSAAMHAEGKLVSVTVPAGYPVKGAGFNPSSGYWVYAWKDIIGLIDRLPIMTYDYSWDTAGPIGPADWVDEVASDAVEELGAGNARKVGLGIASYGRDWIMPGAQPDRCASPTKSTRYTVFPYGDNTIVRNAVTRFSDAWSAGKLTYPAPSVTLPAIPYDAVKGEYTYSYKEADVDRVTKAACTNYRTVWFQDGRSHVQRALIAAKYQLAGVALWAFGDESDTTWTRLTTAAPQIRPYRPTVTASAPAQVTYGTSAAVLVSVTRPGGAGDPGIPLTLKWRAAGATTWTTIGTSLTNDLGAATFITTPTRNGQWQVTAPSATGRQSSVSSAVTTLVAPRVSAGVRTVTSRGITLVSVTADRRVTATVPRGTSARISGRVTPVVGQRVTLLRQRASGSWEPIASQVVTSGGYVTFQVSTAVRGTTRYQLRSSASSLYAVGKSLLVELTVR